MVSRTTGGLKFQDFNRDLDGYLKGRRIGPRQSLFSRFGPRSAPRRPAQRLQVEEEEETKEFRDRGFMSRMVAFITGRGRLDPKEEEAVEKEVVEEFSEEMDEIEEKEQELRSEKQALAKKRGSVIRDFFASLNFLRSRENYDEDVEEASQQQGKPQAQDTRELMQDMREVGKITVKVMQQIPAHKIRAFKESDEFKTFRELMKKYDLIK